MLRRLRVIYYGATRCYHKSPHSVDIPECGLHEYIFRDIDKTGNRTALVDGISGKTWTYNRLYEETTTFAANLCNIGFLERQVVCLFGTNRPEFAHVICGVASIGGTLTIANSQLTPRELSQQQRETSAKYTICTADCAAKAMEAKSMSPEIQEVIVFDADHTGCRPFSDLLAPRRSTPPVAGGGTGDVLLLPYSSGTTGLPKGVQLTHRNIVAEIAALSHRLFLPFSERETSLSFLPMVHIAGMVIGMLNPLAQGATVVTLPRFEPKTFLQSIQKYRPSFSLLAPPVVNFLATHPLVDQYDVTSLHTPYSGAASLGKAITEMMVDRLNLTGIRQGYGMSESSPATHTTPLDGWKYGSIGVPLPNTESKIVDITSGASLGPNENGEIWIRGPQVMKGYLGNEHATRETITEDGWLKSGDIGYYDDDGHYYVVDRLKEIIKYKGYQVAPAYLESVLLSHPSVEDAAVVGIPHPVHGEIPRAYVVCNELVDTHSISTFVDDQVAPYKRLRGGVVVVESIPRSPSGKILRRLLRDQLIVDANLATS